MRQLSTICLLGLLGVGCSAPPQDDRVILITPDRGAFDQVSPVLASHCGSLDCHGTTARNMTIYSRYGLRLSGQPGGGAETAVETDANFLSVVTLEPEQLALVVRDGGAQPERLTIVRKARGTEHHKGGTAMAFGSPGDLCLTSWLRNALDTDACTNAEDVPNPLQQ